MQTLMMHTLTDTLKKRQDPGILIFDLHERFLFMNKEAHNLLKGLISEAADRRTDCSPFSSLPPEVRFIYYQSREMYRRVSHEKNGRAAKRCVLTILENSTGYYCLRAFSLHETQHRNTLILLLIEKVRGSQKMDIKSLEETYGVTPREGDVIKYLLAGCTNKEIAASLRIEVNTVKDYLKNIMRKMGVTTRTAVLSKIIYSGQERWEEPRRSTAG